MSIKYNYNRSGSERKPLVEAVSQMLDQPAIYQGAPTFAYAIGGCSIDKNGVLSCGDDVHPEAFKTLVEALKERGFTAENVTVEDIAAAGVADGVPEAVTESASGDNTLTVEIPKDGFTEAALENLHKIISSKETLLKKALETDSLPIIDTGDTLRFPWFTLHGMAGEADAYSRLTAAICSMAKEQKRVTAKECSTENEKFSMRLFLIRLGFIGDEYKTARKLLLRNLTGNSSWKSGHAPERPRFALEAEPANTVSDTEPTNIDSETKEGGEPNDK